MEDAEIVKLFFARAETAITALREKYGARALRVGCDITGSEQDAEECVSDACLALWQSIPPTKPLYLGAYFIAAVRNHALMRVRAGQAQRRGGKSYDAAFDELGELLADPNTPGGSWRRGNWPPRSRAFCPRSPVTTASYSCAATGSPLRSERSRGISAAARRGSKARCTAAAKS